MLKFISMSLPQILNHLNRRSTPLFPKIPKITKFLILAFIITSSFFLIKSIFAEENIIKYTQDAQKSGNNSEAWQLNSWNTTAINALTSLTGEIPFDDKGNMKLTNYVPSGMLGVANNMVASLYVPQASGIQYIAQIKDNFLGRPVYAQGVGFKGLQPLLPAWRSFRNIVYVLFSLVFVSLGIMIMLRVKISPQAVVTIQSAIPGLITSLILVTFSYAIAGLIIDLSYWVQSVAIALLFHAKGVDLGENFFTGWKGGESLGITNLEIYGGKPFDFPSLANSNFTWLNLITMKAMPIGSMFMLASAIGQIVLGTIVGGIFGILGSGFNIVGQVIGGWVGGVVIGIVGGVIMIVILLVMVIIWLIKLWFGLLKTYINIILQIVTAPFVIGMGAFPNSKIGFSSWFIGLVANVAVFPIVLVAVIFIGYLAEIVNQCQLWIPNLLNMTLQITDIGTCSSKILGAAVGIAGLAMISKLPELVPQAIFQLKPTAFGNAVGEGLGSVGKGPVGSFVKQGALEAGGQKIANRWGDVENPGKLGRTLTWMKDTAETAGVIKEKRPSGKK